MELVKGAAIFLLWAVWMRQRAFMSERGSDIAAIEPAAAFRTLDEMGGFAGGRTAVLAKVVWHLRHSHFGNIAFRACHAGAAAVAGAGAEERPIGMVLA